MKTAFAFLAWIFLAIFSDRPAQASASCESNPENYLQAVRAQQENRFLLASIYFSKAEAESCSEKQKSRARLGFADSLFSLGEREFARKEIASLVSNPKLDLGLRKEAELKLVFMDGPADGLTTEPAKLAADIWGKRRTKQEFEAAIDSSKLSDKQITVLKKLAPPERPSRSPLLAGIASAAVPGAGQVYNGQYQTAALSIALNGLFLFSTIELAKEGLGFTAALSGIAFSTVYLGNIISAVQGAKAVNERSSKYREEQLKNRLLEISHY